MGFFEKALDKLDNDQIVFIIISFIGSLILVYLITAVFFSAKDSDERYTDCVFAATDQKQIDLCQVKLDILTIQSKQ